MIRNIQYSDGTSLDFNRPKSEPPPAGVLPYEPYQHSGYFTPATPPAMPTRPISWPALTPFVDGQPRIQLLVYTPGYVDPLVGLSPRISCTGTNMTINWGDGSAPTSINSGQTYNHAYFYNKNNQVVEFASQSCTSGIGNDYLTVPSTPTIPLFTPVRFTNITNIPELNDTTIYYIVSIPTSNRIKIATSQSGTPITFTTIGSVTINSVGWTPYLITIEGTAITGITFYTALGDETNWLKEWSINSSTFGSITFNNTEVRRSIQSISLGENSLSFDSLFRNYESLIYFPLGITKTITTTTTRMFQSCYAMSHAPELTFSGQWAADYMFNACYNLHTIPAYPTLKATNIDYICTNCYTLQNWIVFDYSALGSMMYAYNNCFGLMSVPDFTAPSLNNVNYAFDYCYRLEKVPLITGNGSMNLSYTFRNCSALYDVTNLPALVAGAGNLAFTFQNCIRITSIPAFTTNSSCNQINATFNSCSALQKVGTITIGRSIVDVNLSNIFNSCKSLLEVPEIINFDKITNLSSAFYECKSIHEVPDFDYSNIQNLQATFQSSGIRNITFNNLSACNNLQQTFSFCPDLDEITIPVTQTNCNITNIFSYSQNVRRVNFADETRLGTITSAFNYCNNLVEVYGIDNIANKLRFTGVTTAQSVFLGCYSLKSMDITFNYAYSAFNTSNLFSDCIILEHLKITHNPSAYVSLSSCLTNNYCIKSAEFNLIAYNINSVFGATAAGGPSISHVYIKLAPTFNCSSATNPFTSLCSSLESLVLEFVSASTTTSTSVLTISNLYNLRKALLIGYRDAINISNACLSAQALNDLFNSLGSARQTGLTTITITGNPGIFETGYNPGLANAKGWVVSP